MTPVAASAAGVRPAGVSDAAPHEIWWHIISHRGEVVALHVDRMANDQWGLMLYRNDSFWQYRRVESKESALAQSAVWLRQCRDKDPDEAEADGQAES
jgi:hypothetical protein